MRIVKADATTAETQAQKALSDPGGLLSTPADDAMVAQSGGRNNDIWVVGASYTDCRMNAALVAEPGGGAFPRPREMIDYGEERLRGIAAVLSLPQGREVADGIIGTGR